MTSADKAAAILPFVGVLERDEKQRPAVVWTPAAADNGPRFALVRIARNGRGINLTCNHFGVNADADEGTPCRAGEHGRLCYHCRAAMILAAREGGCRCEFHAGEQWAARARKRAGAGWVLTINYGGARSYLALIPMTERPAKPAAVAPVKSTVVKADPVKPAKDRPAKGKGKRLAKQAERFPVAVVCRCGAKLTTVQEEANQLCERCSVPTSKGVQPIQLG